LLGWSLPDLADIPSEFLPSICRNYLDLADGIRIVICEAHAGRAKAESGETDQLGDFFFFFVFFFYVQRKKEEAR